MSNTAFSPIAVPISRAGELVGCSRSQFYKVWIGEGWVKPFDAGGRGESVLVEEVLAAARLRADRIRTGEITAPIRSARRKTAKGGARTARSL